MYSSPTISYFSVNHFCLHETSVVCPKNALMPCWIAVQYVAGLCTSVHLHLFIDCVWYMLGFSKQSVNGKGPNFKRDG